MYEYQDPPSSIVNSYVPPFPPVTELTEIKPDVFVVPPQPVVYDTLTAGYCADGVDVGCAVGVDDGVLVGVLVGSGVGVLVAVGVVVGCAVGVDVGVIVG